MEVKSLEQKQLLTEVMNDDAKDGLYKINKMKQEHKDYLEANINNYHTVQNGYVRNLDIHLLNMYEHIYREYLDPQFVLTKWCSSCVMDMLQRLYPYYLSLPQEQVQDLKVEPKKKGRPKK